MARFWRTRWALWALYLAALVALVPLAGLVYVLSRPDPDCVEFECIGGWDAVVLVGWFLGLPYVAALTVLLALAALVPNRWWGLRNAVAAVGLAAPWVIVLWLFGTGP